MLEDLFIDIYLGVKIEIYRGIGKLLKLKSCLILLGYKYIDLEI